MKMHGGKVGLFSLDEKAMILLTVPVVKLYQFLLMWSTLLLSIKEIAVSRGVRKTQRLSDWGESFIAWERGQLVCVFRGSSYSKTPKSLSVAPLSREENTGYGAIADGCLCPWPALIHIVQELLDSVGLLLPQ